MNGLPPGCHLRESLTFRFVDSALRALTITSFESGRTHTRNRNEETFGVPLDQRPGMFVPIPCRHCGKSFIRFALETGERTVVCARCGGVTEVRVTTEGEALRVRTARGAVRAKSTD